MTQEKHISRIDELLQFGGISNYVGMKYNEEHSDLQRRLGMSQYSFYMKNLYEETKTLVFVTRDEVINIDISDELIDLFWSSLECATLDEEGELDCKVFHFEAFEADLNDVYHWFEWFFDISIGKRYFKSN